MMTETEKEFDCVEMMHRGQEAVRKRLEGKTREEQLEYWRVRMDELQAFQNQLRQDTSLRVELSAAMRK
jgi:hypothetical protein